VVSSEATVIERYTRLSMGELLYQFTVIDPKVYSEPWTGEYSIYPLSGNGRIFEHACHEGNYAMTNILKGARVLDERKAAAAKLQTASATVTVPAKPKP
jgi:hypothetical protein